MGGNSAQVPNSEGSKGKSQYIIIVESTVRSLINLYASTRRINSLKRGGITREYIPDFINEKIVDLVNENAALYLKFFMITIWISSVYRILGSFFYGLKNYSCFSSTKYDRSYRNRFLYDQKIRNYGRS
jgi:hypothetical protein